mgnify:CR=1 FL=1|tara:strand:+ start:1225 stop:1401 length:177 start_codon:yes stop_codon:yes gene_type:complete
MTKHQKKIARAKRLKKKMNIERASKTKTDKDPLRANRTKVTFSHTSRRNAKIRLNLKR